MRDVGGCGEEEEVRKDKEKQRPEEYAAMTDENSEQAALSQHSSDIIGL